MQPGTCSRSRQTSGPYCDRTVASPATHTNRCQHSQPTSCNCCNNSCRHHVHVSPPHFVVAKVAGVARLRVPTVTELWPVRLRTQTGLSVHNRRHPTAATTRAGMSKYFSPKNSWEWGATRDSHLRPLRPGKALASRYTDCVMAGDWQGISSPKAILPQRQS